MVEMNRGEASEYIDGAVFALFGDYKYLITHYLTFTSTVYS